MATYDWAWVEAHVDEAVDIWNQSAGRWAPETRSWSPEEQRAHEDAYDEGLLKLEAALESPVEDEAARDRIVAAFGQFSARALHLDGEAPALLTEGFLPIGVSLATWARRFDPSLSMAGIIQAARNAWTACGLQPLFGVPMGLTPSILGYSLIYPYSDNLLDDENIPGEAKLRFSRRLRQRLLGEELPAHDEIERRVWALVALIETQYQRTLFKTTRATDSLPAPPRGAAVSWLSDVRSAACGLYPNVFESLLAIHRAQEQSLAQQSCGQADSACLRISCAKGGSSVLADACLAYGSLTPQESRFAFEWGVLLQLGDDLQDVRDDLRPGAMTLFSLAAAEGRPLDGLTAQLLRFGEHTGRRLNELRGGSAAFKELLMTSWRSLILSAVADSSEFFSSGFRRDVEPFSPFRFDFLRARKSRLAGRQGLYGRLFSTLSGLPPAERLSNDPAACGFAGANMPDGPPPGSSDEGPQDFSLAL